jgi:hypothetical protein
MSTIQDEMVMKEIIYWGEILLAESMVNHCEMHKVWFLSVNK